MKTLLPNSPDKGCSVPVETSIAQVVEQTVRDAKSARHAFGALSRMCYLCVPDHRDGFGEAIVGTLGR